MATPHFQNTFSRALGLRGSQLLQDSCTPGLSVYPQQNPSVLLLDLKAFYPKVTETKRNFYQAYGPFENHHFELKPEV